MREVQTRQRDLRAEDKAAITMSTTASPAVFRDSELNCLAVCACLPCCGSPLRPAHEVPTRAGVVRSAWINAQAASGTAKSQATNMSPSRRTVDRAFVCVTAAQLWLGWWP